MSLTVQSPCKVNLILNVLPRRHDGFHALESLFLPVPLCDEITLDKAREGVKLSCSNPGLSVGADNLVRRAAEAFVTAQGEGGARIMGLPSANPSRGSRESRKAQLSGAGRTTPPSEELLKIASSSSSSRVSGLSEA